MCKDPVTGVSIIHSQNKHEAGIHRVKGNMVDLGRRGGGGGGNVKRCEECGLSPQMGKKLISRSCHCYWDMGRCFPRRPSKLQSLQNSWPFNHNLDNYFYEEMRNYNQFCCHLFIFETLLTTAMQEYRIRVTSLYLKIRMFPHCRSATSLLHDLIHLCQFSQISNEEILCIPQN